MHGERRGDAPCALGKVEPPDSGSVTRWAATFALAKAGRWKLVASALADADHSAATSSPAYVTVVR